MYNMLFSKRVALVTSLLVLIPLTVLLTAIMVSGLKTQVKGVQNACLDTVNLNALHIEEKLDTFDRIETAINTNEDLKMFFINPDDYDEEETISTLKNQTAILENVFKITPYLYSVSIFASDKRIPERWPVIMQESRLSGKDLKRWSFNYQADYMGNQDGMKEPSICSTRKLYKNHRLIGYIQIAVKMADFFPSVYTAEKGANEYILYPCNENLGCVLNDGLSSEKPELTAKELKTIKKMITASSADSGKGNINHWNKNAAWIYIPELEVYLLHVDSGKQLTKELFHDLLMIFSGLIVFVFILILCINRVTEKLLSGMYLVINGMKKVKEGDFSVQIPVSGIDEISETQETFNAMTRQLQDQIEQIKKEQSLIADTEMKAMQNQINAHFLYNVLETIRMQAVLADQDDIEESLQVLGRMMRYCLRWRIHRVSLSQEIDYIRSYIYILNIRNDYSISLEIEIPEDLMDVEIPKMTLQPLVENAFVHAIEVKEQDATLKVEARSSEDGSRIILSVQDFGDGMDDDTLTKIREYLADDEYERDSKGSIGLKNIQQRLTVFYGPDYRIEIESEKGKGTTIKVPVPNVRSIT